MLTTSTDLLTEILMKLIAVQQKRPSAGKPGKPETPFNRRKKAELALKHSKRVTHKISKGHYL